MFLRSNGDAHWLLVPQASHAFLAWQVALHWGNRRVARPAPRPEVLAAVLLHDSGWDAFDTAPDPDAQGRPRTFDRMEPRRHLEIWRRCIALAGAHATYAGMLVALHCSRMAAWKISDLEGIGDAARLEEARRFAEDVEKLVQEFRALLAPDPRYAMALDGPGLERNLGILGACDRLAVYLCAGMSGPFALSGHSPGGDEVHIAVDPVDGSTLRLHPWPLEGRRLTVHCEARRLQARPYAGVEELKQALSSAPRLRLAFTLLAPGEPTGKGARPACRP